MRLVETAVLQIELHEEGPPDGQPLLLLHGWPDAPRGARLRRDRSARRPRPRPRPCRWSRLGRARRLHARSGRTGARHRDRRPGASVSAARRLHDPAVRASARLLVPVADVPRRRCTRRRHRSHCLCTHPMGHVESARVVRRRRVPRDGPQLHEPRLGRDHSERLPLPLPRRRGTRPAVRTLGPPPCGSRVHRDPDADDPRRGRPLRRAFRVSPPGAVLHRRLP